MKDEPLFFDTVDDREAADTVPRVEPWRRVPLDPDYSGAWVVAGDVDNDGRIEILSARNVNRGDVHFTSAVAAHDLDGRVLWRWGDPHIGRRGLHHDVACQIHDWNGDGRNEVILCSEGWLVELDGATGAERRRLPLPPEATDCLVFADLAGRGRAAEVLVKSRYRTIWALDYCGKTLWTVQDPGGYATAHQPVPIDIDGDGRDEVMAGYALLGPDGHIRWTLEGADRFAGNGHLDCCRVLRRGTSAEEWRLALTCCGHQRLLAVDGNGKTRWESAGHHFESIDVGRICPGRPGPQILVDLVPPPGVEKEYPLWVVSADGERLGQLTVEYGRFHTLADWNGDGIEEIVVPHSRGLFDARGQRTGTFAMESQADLYGGQPPAEGEIGNIVLAGNFTGRGARDVAITTPAAVYLFANPSPPPAPTSSPLGCGPNFTLY